MYKVIKYFTDLHDNNHPYNVGDVFPREGVTVKEERLAELAGSNNKQGVPLIERVVVEEAPTQEAEAVEEAPKKPAKRGSRKAAE